MTFGRMRFIYHLHPNKYRNDHLIPDLLAAGAMTMFDKVVQTFDAIHRLLMAHST